MSLREIEAEQAAREDDPGGSLHEIHSIVVLKAARPVREPPAPPAA
jgi:hypothetical protein